MANEHAQTHRLAHTDTHTPSCCGKTEFKDLLHSNHLHAASNHLDMQPTANLPFALTATRFRHTHTLMVKWTSLESLDFYSRITEMYLLICTEINDILWNVWHFPQSNKTL